ncbi:hypothetical protein Moror_10167 [Moniliophthora roreri MCA 2997]|uniref:Uncharacterized protein n=1 Tax=Moniliophthora roreri (strain MCA 2997) TaxID=1381753 RepID=V2WC19_MONRO|nr:hypothetical protein Moror_10167 [Moniliophthora roreri MCA 2997]
MPPQRKLLHETLNKALLAVVGIANTHLEALTDLLRRLMVLLNDGFLAPTAINDPLDSPSASLDGSKFVDMATSEGIPDDLPTPPGLTLAPTATRQLCEQCHTSSLEDAPDHWYAVWSGIQVGWVKGLDLAKELTFGIPKDDWCYFPSEHQAHAAFLERYKVKKHHILTLSAQRIDPQCMLQPEFELLGPAMGWVMP